MPQRRILRPLWRSVKRRAAGVRPLEVSLRSRRRRARASLFITSTDQIAVKCVKTPRIRKGRVGNAGCGRVFRGRHVADFTDLSSSELADYSQDIQTVGLMIERVFRPCHVNYLLLGNIVPHLHVHVVPRYLDDPAPERPLPWEPFPVPEELFAEQFQ